MTETFVVESNDNESSLTLSSSGGGSFVADIRSRGLTAGASVDGYLAPSIGAFFGELAANWTGWSGDKTWGSLEEELSLKATSDRTGHVYLDVHLQQGTPAIWAVRASLIIEAGQLERLALKARSFERDSMNAESGGSLP